MKPGRLARSPLVLVAPRRRRLFERQRADDRTIRGRTVRRVAGCRRRRGRNLTIFGAASLKGALDKAKTAYEAANPGTTLTISTDSSSALETQIEQGAPADVFLSADTDEPEEARRRRLRGAATPVTSRATS